MQFWQNLLRILDYRIETPKLYGPIHIGWIVSIIATSALLIWWQKKKPADRQRKIILITSIIVILFEIYKQINYSFSYENGITFNYQWYAFPFQYCSTPMYVGLLAGLVPKGRFHKVLCSYLATYAMFAGLCVMFYPGDVYISTLGINIQTMICHGSMIVIAVYLLSTEYVDLSFKTVLRGTYVFAVCIGIAMILNEIAYYSGLLNEHTFNMFLISPHCEPSLPVYSIIQNNVPYPFCLLFYIGAFGAASCLIIAVSMLIKKAFAKKESKAEIK